MINNLDFKIWLQNCISDGLKQGLSEEDILICLLEKTLEYMILVRIHMRCRDAGS